MINECYWQYYYISIYGITLAISVRYVLLQYSIMKRLYKHILYLKCSTWITIAQKGWNKGNLLDQLTSVTVVVVMVLFNDFMSSLHPLQGYENGIYTGLLQVRNLLSKDWLIFVTYHTAMQIWPMQQPILHAWYRSDFKWAGWDVNINT